MVNKRKFVDWGSIEPLYRAGQMSLNDICCQYAFDHQNSSVWKLDVTHSTICKYAKDKKWSKNLANKVKDRIQEKLTTGLTTGCGQNDESVIESASEEPVKIAIGQRARTQRLLNDQDNLALELRENKENLDVVIRVKAFKDISAAVSTHHAEQVRQYHIDDTSDEDKSRIKVSRKSLNE